MCNVSRSVALFLANIVTSECLFCIKHTTWPVRVRRLPFRIVLRRNYCIDFEDIWCCLSVSKCSV
jgi:hypothetical protein